MMAKELLAIKAFEEYAKERIWYIVREAKGSMSITPENLRMLEHAYLAGAAWGREQEKKAAAPLGARESEE